MAYKINVLKSLQSNPKTCLSAIRKYLINMLVYFADVTERKWHTLKSNPTEEQNAKVEANWLIIHNERQ